MTFWTILTLAVLAVIGNVMIRKYLRNEPETYTDKPVFADPNMSNRSGDELLAMWGVVDPCPKSTIEPFNLPADVAALFERYARVMHPSDFELLDRRLLSKERFGDHDYISIGNWFDGARVFSRSNPDISVYYYHDEYTAEPIVMCRSIDEYLRMADVARTN